MNHRMPGSPISSFILFFPAWQVGSGYCTTIADALAECDPAIMYINS